MSEEQTALAPLTDEAAFQLLQEWFIEKRQLAELRSHEHLSRMRLAEFYFPEPSEGTNRRPASPGFDMKLVQGYDYKVDVAALENFDAKAAAKLGIVLDDLIVYKPELKLSAYRKLSPQAQAVFQQVLDIKPSSPQLDIVPASQKDAEAAALVETAPQTGVLLDTRGPTVYSAHLPDAPPPPTPTPAGPQIRENMEDCVFGDYYQDGDGQWWIKGEADDDWSETVAPTHLEKPAKRRGARKAK